MFGVTVYVYTSVFRRTIGKQADKFTNSPFWYIGLAIANIDENFLNQDCAALCAKVEIFPHGFQRKNTTCIFIKKKHTKRNEISKLDC